VKRGRRDSSRSPERSVAEHDDTLRQMPRMHIDYDEARSSEERSSYHQPRLAAQGEFMLHAHPLARLKAVLARAKRPG
jgi:hypothetical protein